jgi:peroxiredoxin-like protein
VGTNPDEMLLGAAATCYIITLAAMFERSGIRQEALTMESEAIVDVTNGVFTYEKIIHKPHVIITSEFAAQEEKINRLIKKAETSCMISRAIQGNVEIKLEPQLTVKAYWSHLAFLMFIYTKSTFKIVKYSNLNIII